MESTAARLLGNDLFYGWYFKCQNEHQTLALIPAFHREGEELSGSIQIITADDAWNVPFPASVCSHSDSGLTLGNNLFTRRGIRLNLSQDGLCAHGEVLFGTLTPLSYDIMGIVGLLPRLECRHQIVSMCHPLRGSVVLNGTYYSFLEGQGYWEGDSGSSFPKKYLWSHCFFPDGSLMLAAADVPIGAISFTGVIAVVFWKNEEYRFASYLGARAEQICDGTVVIRQGRWKLKASLLQKKGHPLKAPSLGAMNRTIREHPCCTASYSLWEGENCLFSFQSEQASFEYEYPL